MSAIATTTTQAATENIQKEATKNLSIHDIQGEGHKSPYDDKKVENIEGIVTYKYKLNGGHYLHIQTPDMNR